MQELIWSGPKTSGFINCLKRSTVTHLFKNHFWGIIWNNQFTITPGSCASPLHGVDLFKRMGWTPGAALRDIFFPKSTFYPPPSMRKRVFFGSQAFFCTCHRPVPPPSFPVFFCIAFLGSYGYLLAWVHFNSQIKLAGLSVIAALLDPILPCAPL